MSVGKEEECIAVKKPVKAILKTTGKKNKADVDKRKRVKALKEGDDVIQPYKHGPFKADEVIHLEENSRSSSLEVKETDVGAFMAPK